MKTISATLLSLAVMIVGAGASELPVVIQDGVVLEEAWATSDGQGGLEVFLVINNRTLTEVGSLKVDVLGASETELRSASGAEIAPVIPARAELYMQPGGVYILATTAVEPGATVPVSVSVAGTAPTLIDARVLSPGEDVPDHHDYDHG
ncbi:hypothetical protein [Devosia submarina]|uniref:hypothetical protein n=1 Tax=Devosia submarina TaxID=1173082 RepID=UPI000D38B1CF|nr:hypothetical protein [Devosia submarina]